MNGPFRSPKYRKLLRTMEATWYALFKKNFQLVIMQESQPIADQVGDEAGDDRHDVPSNDDDLKDDLILEASFVESDDTEIDEEINNYFEEDRLMATGFIGLERLSCFAHSLQCCIRILDKTTFALPSRKAAFKLMESFSHSTTATQLLIKKAGKKLLTACKTRWSYNCLAFERLLELRGAITQVTDELQNIDNLNNTQWAYIERYVKFTKPFANSTYLIEGDRFATLSQVIPQLEELRHHLEQVSIFFNLIKKFKKLMQYNSSFQSRTINGFIMASAKLAEEIRRRFSYIIDTTHPEFEPIYVVATALDPRYRLILTDEQINAANRHILYLVSKFLN